MRLPGRNVEWATPQHIFDWIERDWGPFSLDPCATPDNAKCETYFTDADNGLAQDWGEHMVFCNPPYSEIAAWVAKGKDAAQRGACVVILVPVYSGAAWWHEHVPAAAHVVFIRGKFKFVGAAHNPMFYTALLVFARTMRAGAQIVHYAKPETVRQLTLCE